MPAIKKLLLFTFLLSIFFTLLLALLAPSQSLGAKILIVALGFSPVILLLLLLAWAILKPLSQDPRTKGLSIWAILKRFFFPSQQFLISTIIPLPSPNPPSNTPAITAAIAELRALGFTHQHSARLLGNNEATLQIFTHAQLPCIATILDYPIAPGYQLYYLSTITAQGVFHTVYRPANPTVLEALKTPRIIFAPYLNATPTQLLAHLRPTFNSASRPPTPEEFFRYNELTTFLFDVKVKQNGFLIPDDQEHEAATQTKGFAQKRVEMRKTLWDQIHVGFLHRHRYQSGQPFRELSTREIAQHIAAHTEQSADHFLSQLLAKLDLSPSAANVRFADAVRATQKSLPRTATGLQACQSLLAPNPNAPLQTLATFDHPVQAILLKIA